MTELLQFTVSGLVLGCIYAIAASGLVLTYATTGVFNFAHGAVGCVTAFVYWYATVEVGMPVPVGLLLIVGVLAPGMGLVLERVVFRRFRQASVETTLVVTVALTLFFLGTTNQLFDDSVGRRLPLLLGDRTIEFVGIVLTYDEILFLGLAVAVAVFLRFFLFTTRLGTTMRAVVDDPEVAELTGADANRIAQASWALGFALAGLSGILFASGRPLSAIVLTFLVLNAYAAAIVGRLSSLPLTFAGAMMLGVLADGLTNVSWLYPIPGLDQLIDATDTFWSRLRLAVPSLFLLGAMLLVPHTKLRSGRRAGRAEPPTPTLRRSLIAGVSFVAVIAALTSVVSEARHVDINRGLSYAIAILALVLVTGYGGQVTLATYVFMALGAITMGNALGGSSPLGLLLAAAVCAPVGALVALPTLRLHGLYLALATFAFALAARELIIQDPRLLGTGSTPVGRPDFGLFEVGSDRAMVVFLSVTFAAGGIGLLAVKRSRYGRLLAAIRDSEAACATLGLDARRVKLAVFSAGAAMSGVAGAIFGSFSLVVADVNFDPLQNLVIFLYAFVGGVTTITGAAIGGLLFTALTVLQAEQPSLGGLVFAGIGVAAVALGKHPNGIAGIIIAWANDLRERWQGAQERVAAERTATAADRPAPARARPLEPTS